MDQVKIGRFLAELRRSKGLTQDALGEKIGVTNKTISRWETGKYMPDIEMLQMLAKEFGVHIDELLSGERLSNENLQKVDEEGNVVLNTSAFSFEDRTAFYKTKWRKAHIPLFIVLSLILIASIIVPSVFGRPYFAGLAPLIACVEYGYQNNKMMIYVESHLYD